MIVIILEDQYTKQIIQDILKLDSSFKFPIKSNIKNPLLYLNIIDNIKEDYIILLDNYFPGKPYEEPLGDLFLQELLKTGKDYKIICISDRGKRLTEEYDGWKEANNKGWIKAWNTTKEGKKIYEDIILP